MMAGMIGLLALQVGLLTEAAVVTVPAGSFAMGRHKLTSDDQTKMRPNILLDDRPVHQVEVSAFRMDAKEVTHGQYAAFVAAKRHPAPYHWTGGKMPPQLAKVAVYNVSWHDALAYCQYRGGRLPTEAEWERAARGGLEGQSYPWGDKFDAKAVRNGTGAGPAEPGRYGPNGFGLYDMAGNMAEWTADWFDREYYAKSPAKDPPGPAEGQYRVIRGGAWSDPASRVTVFFRNWVRPTQRSANIGIRCAY